MINFLSKKSKHSIRVCEDLKTSLIFELLIQLDSNTFQNILSKACDSSLSDFGIILSIDFWPHWNPEGTANKNYIEPDIFIRCENIDIIIEAKRDLNNPNSKQQWTDQITAYNNEYASDKKKCILIAVDGNNILHSEPKENIYKTSWERIHNTIYGYKEQLPNYIYNLFIDAFRLIEIVPYDSIDDFLKSHSKIITVNNSLLDIIKI